MIRFAFLTDYSDSIGENKLEKEMYFFKFCLTLGGLVAGTDN